MFLRPPYPTALHPKHRGGGGQDTRGQIKWRNQHLYICGIPDYKSDCQACQMQFGNKEEIRFTPWLPVEADCVSGIFTHFSTNEPQPSKELRYTKVTARGIDPDEPPQLPGLMRIYASSSSMVFTFPGQWWGVKKKKSQDVTIVLS